MIKTEAKRAIVKNNIQLPSDVRKALDNYNKRAHLSLDLIYNLDDNQWEFYSIKHHGVVPDEDLLHWQMSVPAKGTGITPGVLRWLFKYDTSNGGMKDQDQIKKEWLAQFKVRRFLMEEKNEKRRKDDYHSRVSPIIKDLVLKHKTITFKTQIVVPKTVGMQNGKLVYAVPKGTAEEMKKQRKLVADGTK